MPAFGTPEARVKTVFRATLNEANIGTPALDPDLPLEAARNVTEIVLGRPAADDDEAYNVLLDRLRLWLLDHAEAADTRGAAEAAEAAARQSFNNNRRPLFEVRNP